MITFTIELDDYECDLTVAEVLAGMASGELIVGFGENNTVETKDGEVLGYVILSTN